MNRKLRNMENLNFLFGWREPFVMIFDEVGGGQESQMGAGVVGIRRAR